MRTPYTREIAAAAARFGLDAEFLEGQVVVESSGHTDAFRFESGFYERYLRNKPEWAGANPRRISSSYGLLQLMFPVAKECGYIGEPEGLFVPSVGLEWGARYLRSLLDWAEGDLTRALAAYNGGKGAAMKHPYPTQAYVDRVFHAVTELS